MRALYDTAKYLTSFNFFEWLLVAEARGATRVVFDIRGIRGDKWPVAVARRRFWSILAPGPALIGLPCETFDASTSAPTNAKDIAKPGGAELVSFWKGGGRFKRLKSPIPAAHHPYTVTLRKTQRSPLRDSDEAVWRDFAEEIGATVIPDYDTQPIELHDRMALYAGARMNFFVSNGPGLLCSWSPYPCMLFNTVHATASLAEDGIEYGAPYPWCLQNQKTIWECATPESLRRHFYYWRKHDSFAEDRIPPRA